MVATTLNNQFWHDNHNPNDGKKDPTWKIFAVFICIVFISCLISSNDGNHQSPRYDTIPVQDDVITIHPPIFKLQPNDSNLKNQENGTKSNR